MEKKIKLSKAQKQLKKEMQYYDKLFAIEERIQTEGLKEIFIEDVTSRYFLTPDGNIKSLAWNRLSDIKLCTLSKRPEYKYFSVSINDRDTRGFKKKRVIVLHRCYAAVLFNKGVYALDTQVRKIDDSLPYSLDNIQKVTDDTRKRKKRLDKTKYTYVVKRSDKDCFFAVPRNNYIGTYDTAEEASIAVVQWIKDNNLKTYKTFSYYDAESGQDKLGL